MNLDKTFYNELMHHMFAGPLDVRFWDGEVKKYGEGEPRFSIIFNEPMAKSEIISDPSMTLGEGYMQKKIEIEGSVQKVIESTYTKQNSFLNEKKASYKIAKLFSNTIRKNKENVRSHYDIGNDFYKLWLDKTMTYSCAYFTSPEESLEQAQRNKVEHILCKLNMQPGQTLLDIGCGWGELILMAAESYKVKALGVTHSSEQYLRVKERINEKQLQDLVEVQQIDFRELKDRTFDRVVSVGMIEHLGKENINDYFAKVQTFLNEGGITLLHCITGRSIEEEKESNSWINKYIFPGGYIPAIQELVTSIVDNNFYLIDLESLREHYTKTLEHWSDNFERAIPEIMKMKDETFIRMWRLYLNSCAASFHCGYIDLHQFLLTKGVNNNLPLTRMYMQK